MKRRPTPIERHIAGESEDRRVRYAERAVASGLVRSCVWVPMADVAALREFAAGRVALWKETTDLGGGGGA